MTILDDEGNPVEGAQVEVTIEGATYTAKTNMFGKAVFQSLDMEDFPDGAEFEASKEGYDDTLIEELYLLMDSMQTLIEDFFHIIGEKESQILVSEINILLKPLREYRNCKERAAILATIKEHSEVKTLQTDLLLCEHEKALIEKIAYALKLLRSSTFYV